MSSGEAGSSWPGERDATNAWDRMVQYHHRSCSRRVFRGRGADDTTSADDSTVARTCGEAEPLGIAAHGVSTASDLAVSSGIAGSARPGERDTTNADVTAVARSAGKAQPLGIAKCSLLGSFGLLESKSMVPRQNPILQCRLKLGLVESSNSAATKPELAESSGEAASPWSTAGGTTNAAAVAAVTNSADEARPPGFAKHSHSQCRPVMLDLLGPGKVARPEVSKCPKNKLKGKVEVVKNILQERDSERKEEQSRVVERPRSRAGTSGRS